MSEILQVSFTLLGQHSDLFSSQLLPNSLVFITQLLQYLYTV